MFVMNKDGQQFHNVSNAIRTHSVIEFTFEERSQNFLFFTIKRDDMVIVTGNGLTWNCASPARSGKCQYFYSRVPLR